eukprot:gene44347-54230_t
MLGGIFASSDSLKRTIDDASVPPLEVLQSQAVNTDTAKSLKDQGDLRLLGLGAPHTDAKIRLFGAKEEEIRVTFFRDTAAWCPYCQKVWIMLEEKHIPYRVEKINMRSYGDKPDWFLQMVPNGLLPAIKLDGEVQTESLDIMLNLEATFQSPSHPKMWPNKADSEYNRAVGLMRLERDLFSRWCSLLFRPSRGDSARLYFEEGLDLVNQELSVSPGPWFLSYLSVVDLTFVSHVERMCASLAYWSNLRIRNNPRWLNIERWLQAFEQLPSYQATKSDYYTHVMDIPPQYGAPYPSQDYELMHRQINGKDNVHWRLPLPDYTDFEPYHGPITQPEQARHEAAFKLNANFPHIVRFACRGGGKEGRKKFSAPLADPYAEPNMDLKDDVDALLRV